MIEEVAWCTVVIDYLASILARNTGVAICGRYSGLLKHTWTVQWPVGSVVTNDMASVVACCYIPHGLLKQAIWPLRLLLMLHRNLRISAPLLVDGTDCMSKYTSAAVDVSDSGRLGLGCITSTLCSSSAPVINPNEIMTSRAITFRDPETGAIYVQTQLLQVGTSMYKPGKNSC